MTDDFKKKLFDYITGNYEIEQPSNNIQISENERLQASNVYSTLSELDGAIIKGIITDKDNKVLIYYGSFGMTQTYYDGQGFILIADFAGNVIELFTTYEGGTNLPNMEYLTYAEDGTFYGITANTSGVAYLTLLNNFTITLTDTYSIKYRQSYQLDSSSRNAIIVKKKPNDAKYVFVSLSASTPNGITKILIAKVEISVGSENVWTNKEYDVNTSYFGSLTFGSKNIGTHISWLNDDYYVKFGGIDITSQKYKEYRIVNDGNATTYTSSFTPGYYLNDYRGGVDMISFDKTYVSYVDQGVNYYIYEVTSNSETLIYTAPTQNPGGYSLYFKTGIVENKLFFAYYCTYLEIGTLGFIDNQNAYEIADIINGIYESTIIYGSSQFNMNTIYLDNPYFSLDKFILLYNSTNYNGLDYQALNSMIPESSILYDEDDKIVFARNLYNKVINGGTTTSTLEVPNNYLNDITILKEQLISETNSIINNDTNLIEKNIYEQLYINFINTLNVIDKNNTTQILNPNGASRINNSISNLMDYDDIKITKFIINYSDNTSDVRNFCSKTYSLTENRCTYTCIIYVPLDKTISNIQIKSNDGNTTYLTIDTSSLVGGKYYRLSQDLVVE